MEMLLVIATIKEVLKTRGGLIEDFKATTRKKEDGRQAVDVRGRAPGPSAGASSSVEAGPSAGASSSSAVPGATFVPEEIYKLAKN